MATVPHIPCEGIGIESQAAHQILSLLAEMLRLLSAVPELGQTRTVVTGSASGVKARAGKSPYAVGISPENNFEFRHGYTISRTPNKRTGRNPGSLWFLMVDFRFQSLHPS